VGCQNKEVVMLFGIVYVIAFMILIIMVYSKGHKDGFYEGHKEGYRKALANSVPKQPQKPRLRKTK